MAHPLHIADMDVETCINLIAKVTEVADEIEKSVAGGEDANIPLRGDLVLAQTDQDQGSTPVLASGPWIVGSDVAPDLYRFAGYVARLDAQMSIISNENVQSGLGLILVLPHDSYLEFSGEAIRVDDMPVYDVLENGPRNGIYLVPADLPVGRYRIHGEGQRAYYATYDRSLERITNDLNRGILILDLKKSVCSP